MTLRDQGDPLSSQTHWSKSWTASFERIDISQLSKCTNNGRECLVQLSTKLSPNITIPQNLFTLVTAAFWYEEGISKLLPRYENSSMSKVTMWRSRWRCVIIPAYSVSFLIRTVTIVCTATLQPGVNPIAVTNISSINIIVWQNVLYFPNNHCIIGNILK